MTIIANVNDNKFILEESNSSETSKDDEFHGGNLIRINDVIIKDV